MPVGGWLLEYALLLDEAHPGFLRWCCGAKPHWRQGLAAAAAEGSITRRPEAFLKRASGNHTEPSEGDLLHRVAELLPRMKVSVLIDAAYGDCPVGLSGALAKLSTELLPDPNDYRTLYSMFAASDPLSRARRQVVEQLPHLTPTTLQIVALLDSVFLIPRLVGRLRSLRQAADLNKRIAVVRELCGHCADDALRTSITDRDIADGLVDWFRRWLRRCDLPRMNLPWEADADLVTVTPANVKGIATEMENCLASHRLGRLVSSVWSAVWWRERSLIVTLFQLTNGNWLVEALHGKGNRPVDDLDRRAVRAKFGAFAGCVLLAEVPERLRHAAASFERSPYLADELDLW